MEQGPILIATVSVGAGHVRAAEAVREALVAAAPARQVDLVDVLNFGPRWARHVYRDGFLRVAAVSRRAAYRLYTTTDGDTPDTGDHRAERLIYHRFRELVARGPWQDIVCTHFLPCQIIDPDRRPALHMVVTDYALHRFWVQPNVDNFFVASEKMAAAVRTRLPRAAAYVTGIPVLERFRQPIDAAAVRRELRIPGSAPVVLIMGGGWGLGVEPMVRSALAARVPELVILTICGANVQAYESVARLASARVRSFAHVDDVARLMAAADLIISKPGGVTTSEALALGKPLLLTQGVPGQEDRNALELSSLGVAELADARLLAARIEEFFASPELRARRVSASEQASRGAAAASIAAYFQYTRERCA